jgi:hypothetical protein
VRSVSFLCLNKSKSKAKSLWTKTIQSSNKWKVSKCLKMRKATRTTNRRILMARKIINKTKINLAMRNNKKKWKCDCNTKPWSRKTTRLWTTSRCTICKRNKSKCSMNWNNDSKCEPLNTRRSKKR